MKVTLTMDEFRDFFTLEAESLNDMRKRYESADTDFSKMCLSTVIDQQAFLASLRRRFEWFVMVYGKQEGGDD